MSNRILTLFLPDLPDLPDPPDLVGLPDLVDLPDQLLHLHQHSRSERATK
jgi:hypothetical protein